MQCSCGVSAPEYKLNTLTPECLYPLVTLGKARPVNFCCKQCS
uniref:Uncharacterized protein n=1 Tax=Anguilla anguilla TaxID=7936 RepID=A0A0E9T7G5_ANGAN